MGKYAELASSHSSGKYAELAAQAPKFNKDEQRGRELPSPAQGGISAISNGLMGFGDEAYGALGGLGAAVTGNDIKQAYLENRDLIRGAQNQYAQDYPVTNAVTGVMAGAPFMAFNPVKAAQLPQATTKMEAAFNAAKLAAQSAKTGAVYGGLYGLGSSEADTVGGVARDVGTNAARLTQEDGDLLLQENTDRVVLTFGKMIPVVGRTVTYDGRSLRILSAKRDGTGAYYVLELGAKTK